MSDSPDPPNWVVERPGLTVVAALSALLALFVLLPYLQFVLFGVVFAYVLFPVERRLERYVRPTLAAGGVVAATVFVVLLPLAYVLGIAVQQSLGVVRAIREGTVDVATVEEVVESTGYDVDLVALYEANQDRIATAIQEVTMGAVDLLGTVPGMFIGVTITLFVFFALLRDGERLVEWFARVIPISEDVADELRDGLDDLMWASVVGNVVVAGIQAVMLGAGLAVAGVPAIVFLTVATFVLTLLPLVGAFGVWVPAAIYLVSVGRPTAGAAIAVYGLFVTFSDSYLRPAIIGGTEAFNSAIVIVGIFGGITVFGAVGLFVGPVVLGGAKLVLDCFARGQAGGAAAEHPSSETGGETGSAEPEPG